MKTRLLNLLRVKSIVTIIMTFTFAFLSIREIISGEQFLIIFTTVVAFYFGAYNEQKEDKQ